MHCSVAQKFTSHNRYICLEFCIPSKLRTGRNHDPYNSDPSVPNYTIRFFLVVVMDTGVCNCLYAKFVGKCYNAQAQRMVFQVRMRVERMDMKIRRSTCVKFSLISICTAVSPLYSSLLARNSFEASIWFCCTFKTSRIRRLRRALHSHCIISDGFKWALTYKTCNNIIYYFEYSSSLYFWPFEVE